MSSAEFDQVQVDISDDKKNIFRSNGSTLKFEGFIKVYVEGKDEQQENEVSGLLPPLAKGDLTPMKNLEALQHFTTPPPRFSEASLVKRLEELGIGRPSTYATILQVLQDRGYAKLVKKFFIPEIRGRLVTAFLTNFFYKYLEYGFTADLEQSLDDISDGSKSKLEILQNFWQEFYANVDKIREIKISDTIDKLNDTLGSFLFRKDDGSVSRMCPECQVGELSLKIGRFGSFIGCSRYPECNYVKKLDSSSISENKETPECLPEYPKLLGQDPADEAEINLKHGPYGFYIQKDQKNKEFFTKAQKKTSKEKPIRTSIPSFIDPNSINLSTALSLLQFPKVLGQYKGHDVKVGIGKFGPYVLFKGKYVSAPKSDVIFSMNLDDAVELINNKRKQEKYDL
jgi:DNA topoisomerase-1